MSVVDEQLREARRRQWAQARARFDESAADREAQHRQREERGVQVTDTIEELETRYERLSSHSELSGEVALVTAMRPTPDRRAALERMIGATNNMQPWNFLARGGRVASTVARISMLDRGRWLPQGTGFLVSERLLMTNNHVLGDAAAAAEAMVEFAVELSIDQTPCVPVPYELDPDGFFVTDPNLDMTLVALRPGVDGRHAGKLFGYNQLVRAQGKIVNGENVNVVGHPMGRQKEISIRENRLELQLPEFLHYLADTEPGNSGSPVFNDQWEVVALHHSGVAAKDEHGNTMRKDGKPWQEGDGDDAIDWVANEGARVSVILKHLSGLQLDEPQAMVLRELGAEAGWPDPAALAPTPAPQPVVETSGASSAREAIGVSGRDDGDVHLVFLHGRSQQGRNPAVLRNSWVAGLNAGLTLCDLAPLAARSVWFPFYGDRLAESLVTQESTGRPLSYETAQVLAPADDDGRMIYEELIDQAARRAGMPEALSADDRPPGAEEGLGGLAAFAVSKLQRQLSWLAARSGLDDAAIAHIFKDVAAYLSRPSVRDAVLDAVAETLPTSGSMVFVTHSLGTVVGMDALSRLSPEVDVRLLVTAGSPLGMDAVYNRLLSTGPERPSRVGTWVNAWAAADAVAIGCPLRDSWGGDVVEIVTDNPGQRAHDIREYLGAAELAQHIGAALSGQRSDAS